MNTETIFKEVNIYQDSLLKYTQSSLVTEFSKSITFEPVGETIASIPSIPNGYEYSILSTIKAVGIFGNPIYRSEKNILIYFFKKLSSIINNFRTLLFSELKFTFFLTLLIKNTKWLIADDNYGNISLKHNSGRNCVYF